MVLVPGEGLTSVVKSHDPGQLDAYPSIVQRDGKAANSHCELVLSGICGWGVENVFYIATCDLCVGFTRVVKWRIHEKHMDRHGNDLDQNNTEWVSIGKAGEQEHSE